MTVKRTTIELDEGLVHAAQTVTGETLRATVERALHELVVAAEAQAAARRQRIADHVSRAGGEVDIAVLLSDQAWR